MILVTMGDIVTQLALALARLSTIHSSPVA